MPAWCECVTRDPKPEAEVDELLGSYEMPSSQFWPGGFDGEVTLTQEEPLGPLEPGGFDGFGIPGGSPYPNDPRKIHFVPLR